MSELFALNPSTISLYVLFSWGFFDRDQKDQKDQKVMSLQGLVYNLDYQQI